jgi:hypothetical protein
MVKFARTFSKRPLNYPVTPAARSAEGTGSEISRTTVATLRLALAQCRSVATLALVKE